jgi:epoxyqueuosine reductase
MKYKDEILMFCQDIGLDTVGFTKCRRFSELIPVFEKRIKFNHQNEFEEQNIDKKINPFLLMAEGKTIISIAFPYLFKESKETKSGFSKYTMGEDYHKVVRGYLNRICDFIRNLGGEGIALVDSNPLPERYIAYLCGIGFIGKNNMLITEKYGSFVFLGEIITDLEVDIGDEYIPEESLERLSLYEKCENCNRCLKSCPTKAINENTRNPNICLSYITQKKHLEDVWFKNFEGRIFGCDTCQNNCPYNENVDFSCLEEFKPYEFMIEGNINELANIDNSIFREKYSKTSCGWRGKNILQRNALINHLEGIKNIKSGEIKSEYVKEYYNRLLNLFKL